MDNTTTIKGKKYLTLKEAADFVGYESKYFNRLVLQGLIPYYRKGRRGQYRFKENELQIAIENNYMPVEELKRLRKI